MRLQGVATAIVVLAQSPKRMAIEVSGVDSILQSEVRQALLNSRFGSCEGNRITLHFDFQLLERKSSQSNWPRSSFVPPNRFVIREWNPPLEMDQGH
jgi:hypothetical protein